MENFSDYINEIEIEEEVKTKPNVIKFINLRDYQIEALTKISKEYKAGNKHIMVKLPTGAGKTVLSASILMNIFKAGKKAMFICDRVELINQTSNSFFEYGIDHGVIQANHPLENWKKNIQVCSIQTLARRSKFKADLIIIDEAHTLFEEHINIMHDNKDIPVIGLSASPFTRGLGKYFQKMVVGATTQQLIELGFLCEPTVYAPTELDLENLKVIKGDYDVNELEKAVNKPKIIGDIIEHWVKIAHNKPTIVFAVNVAHSKSIIEEFKRIGVEAEHIDANTNKRERKQIIDNFKAGKIKVLSSVDILSKGFDYPGVEVAILARPTKSLSLYIQQAGRVLRISPETGKTKCIILDHSGNTLTHGFVTDPTTNELDMGDKILGKKSSKKEKKEREPAVCPSCFMVKDTAICSNCGHEHKPKHLDLSADGYLVRITEDETDIFDENKGKTAKDILLKNKYHLYGELKQWCINKGYAIGKAYFMFKEITLEEPTKEITFAKPKEPSEQLLKYLKFMQIKKAKSKYKKY